MMGGLKIILLSCFVFLAACGDNHPFDEDYWNTPTSDLTEEVSDSPQQYSVTLTPISETVGNISGNVDISINQTDVSSTIQLSEVPQSLMIGHRSISNQTCTEIAANFPPSEIINNTLEFKNLNYVDEGSKESLIAELNQDDPQNGESVNLTGKSYIVKAYVENLNSPIPQNFVLFPVACGLIEAP